MFIVPIACALLLSKQAAAPPTEVTLKFQPVIGKVYQYRMSMNMTTDAGSGAPAMSFRTDTDFDMKALSRDGDVTTLENKMSNAKVTVPDDSPMAAMKESMEKSMSGKVFTTKIDSLYRVKGASGSGIDSTFSAFQNMVFPDHSVKVGDTWNTTMDVGKMLGAALPVGGAGFKFSGSIPINLKLEKIVQNGAQNLAQIHIDMKGDATMEGAGQNVTMHISSSGAFTVDIATGTTTGMKMESTNEMSTSAFSMTQHMTQTMTVR